MVLTIIFVLLIILCIVYHLLTKNHDYWIKRNVPYLTPLPLFGNYKDTILLKKHPTRVTEDICKRFLNVPYIGTFFGTEPALILLDPQLIKLILVTDFCYFNGREVSDYSLKETMTQNLIFSGGDCWRILRQNLSPLYSSSRIKNMFHLIIKCTNQFESFLREEVENSPNIEVRTLLANYSIECMAVSVLGINSNTMNRNASSNPFIAMRENVFKLSKMNGIKTYYRIMWPALFYGLKFKLFDKNVVYFFQNLLSEVFQTRQNTNKLSNDFIDMILDWKKKKEISGGSLSNFKTGDKRIESLKVTDDLLIAQCLALFVAGFETTNATLSFILYEIAKKSNVQLKVIKEVDLYFKKHNGIIEYECIHELPYLAACIQETLRLYPVLSVLTRDVMDNYTLPTGLSLKKGDRIHIPVSYIHQNPNNFEDPKLFKPERFYGAARKNIKPYTFLPYGDGPRMCIGRRFSKMPMYAGILTIFKNYQLELADDMPHSVQIHPYSLVTCSANEINLKFIPRKL